MRRHSSLKSRLPLLAVLALFLVFATGGNAKLTQGPQLDRSTKSDASPEPMPQIDRDAELKAALSSTEVVTAIFELQSEPVVIHEDHLVSEKIPGGKLNLESSEAQVYESQLVIEQENFKRLARELSP